MESCARHPGTRRTAASHHAWTAGLWTPICSLPLSFSLSHAFEIFFYESVNVTVKAFSFVFMPFTCFYGGWGSGALTRLLLLLLLLLFFLNLQFCFFCTLLVWFAFTEGWEGAGQCSVHALTHLLLLFVFSFFL
jgi:hypothetical protein